MMVWNTCENDTRVIKEATTLAAGGYDVTVVCLAAPHLPDVESHAGVTYRRVVRVLSPIRDVVDTVLKRLATAVVAVTLVAVAAAVAALASSFGWWLAMLEIGVYRRVVAASVLFLSGVIVGVFLGRRRLYFRKARRVFIRARRLITRWVFRPVRMKVLWGLYRGLTFRLVEFAMGATVTELNPSIIHAHDLQTLPAAARLAKVLGADLVYDSHELALNVSNPPMVPLRWWMMWLERRTIRRADRVITVSEGIAARLTRRYGIERPTVIYNAPPTAAAGTAKGDVRTDVGIADDVPLAIYVGAPSFHRGLEVLIDGLGLLPDFHLACVGPRNETWEFDLYARATQTQSQDRLHFLDPVPVGELLDYLSTANVGVIAYQNICLNHEFCMPNKLFETVLAGVPVVVGNLRDLRTFVEEHGVGRAADERDPAALASVIREVAADRNLKPTAEKLARLRQDFGWEAQGSRLLALYSGLGAQGRVVTDDPATSVAT